MNDIFFRQITSSLQQHAPQLTDAERQSAVLLASSLLAFSAQPDGTEKEAERNRIQQILKAIPALHDSLEKIRNDVPELSLALEMILDQQAPYRLGRAKILAAAARLLLIPGGDLQMRAFARQQISTTLARDPRVMLCLAELAATEPLLLDVIEFVTRDLALYQILGYSLRDNDGTPRWCSEDYDGQRIRQMGREHTDKLWAAPIGQKVARYYMIQAANQFFASVAQVDQEIALGLTTEEASRSRYTQAARAAFRTINKMLDMIPRLVGKPVELVEQEYRPFLESVRRFLSSPTADHRPERPVWEPVRLSLADFVEALRGEVFGRPTHWMHMDEISPAIHDHNQGAEQAVIGLAAYGLPYGELDFELSSKVEELGYQFGNGRFNQQLKSLEARVTDPALLATAFAGDEATHWAFVTHYQGIIADLRPALNSKDRTASLRAARRGGFIQAHLRRELDYSIA